jgi:hypothetical protein
LSNLSLEVGDLALVEEELPLPQRIRIFAIAELVRAHVGVAEKGFPARDHPVAVVDGGPPLAEGLHLGPLEGESRLECLQYMIVVAGLPVCRNQLGLCHGMKKALIEREPGIEARYLS